MGICATIQKKADNAVSWILLAISRQKRKIGLRLHPYCPIEITVLAIAGFLFSYFVYTWHRLTLRWFPHQKHWFLYLGKYQPPGDNAKCRPEHHRTLVARKTASKVPYIYLPFTCDERESNMFCGMSVA
jgi:hypothetical protein